MTGLDLLLIVSGAIVLMVIGDAIWTALAGPDPDLAAPWFPDRDTPAPLPQRPEPVRGFSWPQGEPVRRGVAPESESEKRAAWGDR